MNNTPRMQAIRDLLGSLPDVTSFDIRPLDLDDACRKYAEDGYDVTPPLRTFLEEFGELTVAWRFRTSQVEVTTSVERTLESAHAAPRNVRVLTKHLGRPVALIGTAFDTEEAMLLAENGDILLCGDAGYQRVANGFENTIRALVTGDWDKTFFQVGPAGR